MLGFLNARTPTFDSDMFTGELNIATTVKVMGSELSAVEALHA
jgi:hypothetical protein